MSHRPPKDLDEQERQARAKLIVHRGMATWGERLVPLEEFRSAVAGAGTRLSDEERIAAAKRFAEASSNQAPVEGPFSRILVFGGVYNNHWGLAAVLEAAARHRVEAIYCLGDLGGFGPNPDKVWPLLEEGEVRTLQGNYEQSLSGGALDCACGYTDPKDNHFAAISYGYTARHCSESFKRYMGTLPARRRVRLGNRELLLVHGSPRRVNEFLFASTSPAPFLEHLLTQNRCDALLCTHTGLYWHRRLASGRDVVNVGVIGRPANDGQTHVWYALLEAGDNALGVQLLPLVYDHQGLAAEMRREELPEEFVETILSGWWTTCLEILPPKERAVSRF